MTRPTFVGLIVAALTMLTSAAGFAGQVANFERELDLLAQGRPLPRRISGAKNRVAVFTYEDPSGTGLGDAVATLMAGEILLRSQVNSIGVILYEGSLRPSADDPLSYFDKVDKIANAQEVTLAVWGLIRRMGDTVRIDSFVQLPRATTERYFRWSIRLPARMGGSELVAHVKPDRVLAQRLTLPADAIPRVEQAAASLRRLRRTKEDDAPISAQLRLDKTFWLEKRESDWVLINTGQGRGWVRAAGHCTADCRPLLSAAKFAGQLLAFADRRANPKKYDHLSDEAYAVRDQIRTLEALGRPTADDIKQANDYTRQWLSPSRVTASATGAAFENIRALLRVAIDLKRAARHADVNDYEHLRINKEKARNIGFDLAEASQRDPRNTDILRNLEVLFTYAGDLERAQLAHDLAARSGAR